MSWGRVLGRGFRVEGLGYTRRSQKLRHACLLRALFVGGGIYRH